MCLNLLLQHLSCRARWLFRCKMKARKRNMNTTLRLLLKIQTKQTERVRTECLKANKTQSYYYSSLHLHTIIAISGDDVQADHIVSIDLFDFNQIYMIVGVEIADCHLLVIRSHFDICIGALGSFFNMTLNIILVFFFISCWRVSVNYLIQFYTQQRLNTSNKYQQSDTSIYQYLLSNIVAVLKVCLKV